jgi:hypothetical protein
MRRTLSGLAIAAIALVIAPACNANSRGDLVQRTSDSSTSTAVATTLRTPVALVATTTTLSPADKAALDAFLKSLEDAKAAAAKKAADEKRALDEFLASLAKRPPSTPPTTIKSPATTAPAAPTGCTNGTYINAAGNAVCRPAASPSAPAGATALCGDGTYSFSQSRSGTCSHHGGVARWL